MEVLFQQKHKLNIILIIGSEIF